MNTWQRLFDAAQRCALNLVQARPRKGVRVRAMPRGTPSRVETAGGGEPRKPRRPSERFD